MAICVAVVSNSLMPTADSIASCTGYVLQTAAEYNAFNTGLSTAYLTLIGVDPESILYVFTWGMGAVLSIWSVGYVAGIVVNLIKTI
jgi:hypothetical protein